MTRVAELRAKWAEAGEEKEFDARFTKMAEVVMRQTNFSLEQAKCALETSNFSIEGAILSFHDEPKSKRDEEPKRSLNQTLFAEFRTFLDQASTAHSRRIERSRARPHSFQRPCSSTQPSSSDAAS